MKLSLLLMVLAVSVSAKNYAQEKVSVNLVNTKLKNIFKSIESQTRYQIYFSDDDVPVEKITSVKIIDGSVTEVMDKALLGLNLSWKIIDNDMIVISSKNVDNQLGSLRAAIIRGKVTTDKGEPLPGASVKIKAPDVKSGGIMTNANGEFVLETASTGNVVLIISYIGYDSKEVTVKPNSGIIQIALSPSSNSLENVVVVGYGSAKKKDLTGAVASAPITEMQKAPVSNIGEALQGRIAGVAVSSPDGQPGSVPNIVIRGNNSVSQSNSPLYVIDGFPIEEASLGAINPNDIESMEILKDASATAIYGARGANGVIIITTKQGKIGPPVVSLSASYGTQSILKTMKLMNAYDYVRYMKERDVLANNFYTNPVTSVRGPGYQTDSTYLRYATLDDYKNVESTDLQKEMFTVSPFRSMDVSVSGGNQQTRYSISGNYFKTDGVMINSGYGRKQGRVVLDQIVNTKLKAGVNVNYSNLANWGGSPSSTSVTGFNSASAPFYGLWATQPSAPLNNRGTQDVDLENDLFNDALVSNNSTIPLFLNPVTNQRNMVRTGSNNILAANAYFEYKILPSLTLRVTGGLTSSTLKNIVFNNTLTSMGNQRLPSGQANGAHGSVIYNENSSWVNENILTYNKVFNKVHSFTVNGIISQQKGQSSSQGQAAKLLPNESLGVNGLDEGTPTVITATSSNWALNSFTGRINYDYKKTYFLTGTYRADGSSRFAPGNKWAYFPSGAFKWRFTNESFFKQNNSVLSDGSLRISYGLTGNNRVGDFSYLSPMSLRLSGGVFNNAIVPAAVPASLANPDLKWETTSQGNIGTDLYFFGNRLTLTADLYRKKTYNLLLNATVPASLGYASVFKNIGSIQNQGLELSLSGVVVKSKDFEWSSSFNISWNQSKVLALAENQDALLMATYFDLTFANTPSYIQKVGQPLGQMYGLVFDGLYQAEDFNYLPGFNTLAGLPGAGSHYALKDNVPTNGNARGAIQPGDVKYKDLNGDGTINASDYTVIGRGLPIGTGGFGNNFRYKDFDLNVFFQYSYGNDIQNANRIMFDGNGNNGSQNINLFATTNDRWTPTNTNTTRYRIGGAGPSGYYSSRTIEDGSYLRLKTVQLGYNLPDKLLKTIGMKTCRIYVSGQNIYTWTKYSGIDPEISTFNSVLTPGFDYSGYPRARTLTMGANILF